MPATHVRPVPRHVWKAVIASHAHALTDTLELYVQVGLCIEHVLSIINVYSIV